jgi:hypothetical protein
MPLRDNKCDEFVFIQANLFVAPMRRSAKLLNVGISSFDCASKGLTNRNLKVTRRSVSPLEHLDEGVTELPKVAGAP